MFKIRKPYEIEMPKSYSMLIYGKPGIGKTTTALSAKNPILLDLENGLKRVPKYCRKPCISVNSFSEVMEFANSNDINEFDTIIIDTMESLIKKAVDRILADDPRLRTKNGNLHLQAYGALKFMINDLLSTLEKKEKNLIFIAHSEERENEKKQKEIVPCMGPGSAGRGVLNMMDIIGYMDKDGDEVVLKFSSSDLEFFSKNALQFPSIVKVANPSSQEKHSFLKDLIWKYQKLGIDEQERMKTEYKLLLNDISEKNRWSI